MFGQCKLENSSMYEIRFSIKFSLKNTKWELVCGHIQCFHLR